MSVDLSFFLSFESLFCFIIYKYDFYSEERKNQSERCFLEILMEDLFFHIFFSVGFIIKKKTIE